MEVSFASAQSSAAADASVCNAVVKACDEVARRLKQSNDDPFAGGAIEVYAENIPQGGDPDSVKNLYAGIDVVAKFVIGFFMLIGIIAWNTLRDAVSSPAKTSNDFTLDRL